MTHQKLEDSQCLLFAHHRPNTPSCERIPPTCEWKHAGTHTHTHARAHTHTHTHMYTHTHTHTHTHTLTHTHTHAHTHTLTHSHTHTHTHTNTHTQLKNWPMFIVYSLTSKKNQTYFMTHSTLSY